MKARGALLFVLYLLLAVLPISPVVAGQYVEDFEEADGVPEDWYVYQEEGVIDMGWLALRSGLGVEPS